MLFTSALFAFVFLPVVWIGFFTIAHWSPIGAASWLLAFSLVFYSQWIPVHTLLLVASVAANFMIGRRIGELAPGSAARNGGDARGKGWLTLGVVANLILLAIFKYLGFLMSTAAVITQVDLPRPHIDLPIGISFFTFTQIAFLCDCYLKGIREYRPVHYALFVTYFPHLVAGPVLHHAQMMPQLADRSTYRIDSANVATGMTLFAIGLAKKVVLADGVSPYADAVFNGADSGATPTAVEAWVGAVAYTFQLYFDFSGYSDMALGISWMFNVRLPFNFDSPYRAGNIAEFWRKWHISLSTFLRDYLYIPLGGNRFGEPRRYLNLSLTMLLGGLWHGASWTFVVWGGLHGLFLTVHQGYRALFPGLIQKFEGASWYRMAVWVLTFVSVVFAWIYFRATTFAGANAIASAMTTVGAGESILGEHPLLQRAGLDVFRGACWLGVLAAIAVFPVNSNALAEWMLRHFRDRSGLRDVLLGTSLVLVVLFILVNETRDAISAFIYFNF